MTAALVLAAHGSRDEAAAGTVLELATLVRTPAPEVPVSVGFLDHSRPTLDEALAAAAAASSRVVVVPLLLTSAWHDRSQLPAVVARAGARHPGASIELAACLGGDDRILSAAIDRLHEAGVRTGSPETGVILGAVGSAVPAANAGVAAVARRLQRRGRWLAVEAGFVTAAPDLREAVGRLRARGARRVALARYALAPGLLPSRLADQARELGIGPVTAVLGAHRGVAETVLDRYRAARPAATLEVTA